MVKTGNNNLVPFLEALPREADTDVIYTKVYKYEMTLHS